MIMEHDGQCNLIDIKKKLGFERDEVYTVHKYPLKVTKSRSTAGSEGVHRSVKRVMSAQLPHSNGPPVGTKPTPSPRPRRVPPKPPAPYKSPKHSTVTPPTTSAPPTISVPPGSPKTRPVIKPKPKAISASKSQNFQKSPEPSPPPLGPVSCSSEENLLVAIKTRPRLNTPRLENQSKNNSPNQSPSKGFKDIKTPPKGSDEILLPPRGSENKPKGFRELPPSEHQTPSKGSDDIILPPRGSDEIILPPRGSDDIILPPRGSDDIILPPRGSDDIILPPRGSDDIILPPRGSDDIILPPRGSDDIILPPRGSDDIILPPRGSDDIILPPRGSDDIILPPRGSDDIKQHQTLSTGSINLESTPEPSTELPLVIDDESGMATVTSNYRPSAYCEVILDENKSTNWITETTNKDTPINEPVDPPYDTTNHVNKGMAKPRPSLQERYSSFNRPDKPDPSTRIEPQYDEIDIDPTSRRPLLVTQTMGYSSLGPSTGIECATPTESKPAPPPKPPRPDIPPKPSVPSRPSSKEPSPSSPASLSSPVLLPKTKESPLPLRQNPSLPKGTNENLCLIDIDQMIANAQAKELKIPGDDEPEEGVVDHTHPIADTHPLFTNSLVKLTDVLDDSVTAKTRAHTMHMYETLPCDIAVVESKPARRKAPPPPPIARTGSPTLPSREKLDDPTKALTMGRKPRSLTVKPTNSFEGKDEERKQFVQSLQQQSPSLIKKTSTGESPGTKSRFKLPGLFTRSSSKDDNNSKGASRGSMKKRSKKNDQQHLSPIKTKSSTLPNRPRGKSLDPYTSSDIYSTVADMEDEMAREGSNSPSPRHQAFAYSIIHTDDVPLRNHPVPRKPQPYRRSQSVEHLYELTRSLNIPSSPSTPQTPPTSMDDFHLNSHIYSDVHTDDEGVAGDGCGDEVAGPEGRESLSPIRDVPHVSVDDGRLYAVVVKPVGNSKKNNTEVEEPLVLSPRDSASPPPPLPPPPRVAKPPIKPAPYSSTISDGNKITTTKTADKYAHLNSAPPTRPLPIPTESRPHPPSSPKNLESGTGSFPNKLLFEQQRVPSTRPRMYDEIDFDNPRSKRRSLDATTPPQNRSHGKIRVLKPKERPAPPPPQESRGTPGGSDGVFLFNKDRINTFLEAGDPQSRLSTSTSDGTISTVETNYYDSDSSEFDPSSDEDDEEERAPKVRKAKTYYIAQEILTTERTFVRGLTLLHKDYRTHMLSANNAYEKTVASEETLNQILSSNLGGIYQLNTELLIELEERLKNWDSNPRLGDVFLKRAPFLKLYSPYISNFDRALKTLEEQSKKNPVFAQMTKEFEMEPKCNNLTVAAYLLETVQRIPRYKLLLADYIKNLPVDSDDREDSEKAYEIIASVASHVNETIKLIENFRKIIEVSKKLIGDVGDSLISPSRKLLKEGELVKSSRKEKQPRMFFLFTDLLVYAAAIPPANTTFRVIKRIPLDGMRVQVLDDPDMKYGFQITSTCKSFRLECSGNDDKEQWMKAFEGAIKDHFNRIQSRQLNRRSMMITDTTDGAESNDSTLGLFAPAWLPDSSVSMCQLCGIHFTVTRRRHHCRACGMIFCGDCSSYIVPLAYKNNKPCRVCQTCCTTLTEREDGEQMSKPVSLKGNRPKQTSLKKKISMPSVLREIRARDDSAQISGYLFHRKDKNRNWKKKWFVVYNLVMYEFKRHEDVSAKQSIPLPSYSVSTDIQGMSDPLVFSLEHSGAGRVLFKADDEDQLESWVNVLEKAVRGETIESPVTLI